MLDPSQTWDKIVTTASVRADRAPARILASSFLGGAYLAFGGSLFVMVSGGAGALAASAPGISSLVCALVFPTGLSMIILSGSDLLTSNMMYATLPFLAEPDKPTERSVADAGKLLGLTFAGNFAGSLMIAGAAAAWVFTPGTAGAAFATALATKKIAIPLGAAIGKAIGANWLVNLAVYQAVTATTTGGKLAGLWMPVTMFVALGLEHSVANMYFLPLGMMTGAEFGLSDMLLSNLLPVTIGNAIGAGAFCAGLQWWASGGSDRIKRK